MHHIICLKILTGRKWPFGACSFTVTIVNSPSSPLYVSQLSKEVAGLNMNFPLQVNTDMPLYYTCKLIKVVHSDCVFLCLLLLQALHLFLTNHNITQRN